MDRCQKHRAGEAGDMVHISRGPESRYVYRWRRNVRKILAASSLAFAATGCVEGAVAAALGTSRSRPLRLAEFGAERQQLLQDSNVMSQVGTMKSDDVKGMQRWHDEAGQRRRAGNQVSELNRLRGGFGASGASDFKAMDSKPGFSGRLIKVQNGLASSRAAIMWVIKGLLAAFTGLLTTSAVMVAFEFTAHKVRPVTGVCTIFDNFGHIDMISCLWTVLT